MRPTMNEVTFLNFYKNTVLGYSKSVQSSICRALEKENRISFDSQLTIDSSPLTLRFDTKDKKEIEKIITETTTNRIFIDFYERWEFTKLYKYSVPFFFEIDCEDSLICILKRARITEFTYRDFCPTQILDTDFKETAPLFMQEGEDKLFVKFVFQKSYPNEEYEPIDYRFPIVLYMDSKRQFLEIRYDNVRHGDRISGNGLYEKIVKDCVDWIKSKLPLKLFVCDHREALDVIRRAPNNEVVVYKQMMEMKSGGAAELTASEDSDYILPFTDEIRGLIEENEELFEAAPEIRELLLEYLAEKELTANYPYIYIKRVQPVNSQSYVVKVIFDYLYCGLKYKVTLLQHITGNCSVFGMERMNDAIEYLCHCGAFTKGEEL